MNDKETLEEVAERLIKDFPHYSVRGNMDDSDIKGWFLEALQKGAKWQQERSYSEEELQQKIDAHLEVAKDLWLSAIKEQKRMYSEEEVVNILIKAYEDIGKRKIPNQVVLASWFKQFKKK